MLPALSPVNRQDPLRAPESWAHSSRGHKEKLWCPRPRKPGQAKGRGPGRVPDLAAERRRPGPRCEALLAGPSGPHDLHFAQKKSGQGAGAPGS